MELLLVAATSRRRSVTRIEVLKGSRGLPARLVPPVNLGQREPTARRVPSVLKGPAAARALPAPWEPPDRPALMVPRDCGASRAKPVPLARKEPRDRLALRVLGVKWARKGLLALTARLAPLDPKGQLELMVRMAPLDPRVQLVPMVRLGQRGCKGPMGPEEQLDRRAPPGRKGLLALTARLAPLDPPAKLARGEPLEPKALRGRPVQQAPPGQLALKARTGCPSTPTSTTWAGRPWLLRAMSRSTRMGS